MIGSFLGRVLVMLFGYAYPAYQCYKSVELNKPEIEQLLFWCQYWILVALFAVFERIGDFFISWLPMYNEAKLAFYMYLWFPKTRGTKYIYETFFRPYIAQHEREIDRNLLELRLRAGDVLALGWQKASSYGQTRFLQIMHYVSSQPRASRTNPVQQQPQVKMQTSQSAISPPAAPQSAVLQHQEEPSTTKVVSSSQAAAPRRTRQATEVPPPPPSPTKCQGQQLERSSRRPVKLQASDSNNRRPPHRKEQAENSPAEDDHHPDAGSQETAIDEAIRARRSRLRKRTAASATTTSS